MRLQRLTGLEQGQDRRRIQGSDGRDRDLLDILAKPERVSTIISGELTTLAPGSFGQTKLGARRSQVEHSAYDLSTEDLIHADRHGGSRCRTAATSRASRWASTVRRSAAGAASRPRATKEDDWIDQLFIANTHDSFLCFSNRGRLYWLKVWEVPAGSRGSPGGRSSTCSAAGRREDQRGIAAHGREPELSFRHTLRVHGHQHGHRQEDGARRVRAIRARPASSRSTWTPATTLVGAGR